jgi:hypothetical protein
VVAILMNSESSGIHSLFNHGTAFNVFYSQRCYAESLAANSLPGGDGEAGLHES